MTNRAFTLIETLVVVALTVVIMLALTFLLQYFYKTNGYAFEQAQAINSARRSTDNAVKDLREASYAADGSYPILIAGTSSITFYADISGTSILERVRYYLIGTSFYRGTTEPAGSPPSYTGQLESVTLVVDNIRNGTTTPIFTYFDSLGVDLGAAPNIGRVSSILVRVMTDVNPLRAPLVYTLTGSATLRNLESQR